MVEYRKSHGSVARISLILYVPFILSVYFDSFLFLSMLHYLACRVCCICCAEAPANTVNPIDEFSNI